MSSDSVLSGSCSEEQDVDPLEIRGELHAVCQDHLAELHSIVGHCQYGAELAEREATAHVEQAARDTHSLRLELRRAEEALACERSSLFEAREEHACTEVNFSTHEKDSEALLQDCSNLRGMVHALESINNQCNTDMAALQRRVAELQGQHANSMELETNQQQASRIAELETQLAECTDAESRHSSQNQVLAAQNARLEQMHANSHEEHNSLRQGQLETNLQQGVRIAELETRLAECTDARDRHNSQHQLVAAQNARLEQMNANLHAEHIVNVKLKTVQLSRVAELEELLADALNQKEDSERCRKGLERMLGELQTRREGSEVSQPSHSRFTELAHQLEVTMATAADKD